MEYYKARRDGKFEGENTKYENPKLNNLRLNVLLWRITI